MKHNEYVQLRDICVKMVIDLALMAAPALAAAPAAPTNFKILEESNKYVKVSFRDRSANETTFSVWRRPWPNGEFSKVGQRYGNPSGTSRVYEILISDSGQPACFRASADNADGRAYSLTACTAATTVGWRKYNDTFFVVKPHNVPASARYRYEDYIHKTWVYRTDAPHHPDSPTNPRTEMAWNKTYVAGYHMWEADVYIPRGTAGSNIFQIFKADHPDGVETTDVMIRMYEEDGGTLKAMNPIHGGFLISTGMYDRWFNLKVAHNITTHLISIYINDERKLTVHDTSPGAPPPGPGNPQAHRFKNGVYGSGLTKAEAHFRNFSFWSHPPD